MSTAKQPNDRKVVTSTGYEAGWDVDRGVGKKGEQLFVDVHTALFDGKVEVKVDRGMWSTGNHYVEFEQECRDGVYRPSGISTTESPWWAIVSPDEMGFMVIRTDMLRALCKGRPTGEQPIRENTNATRGYLVRISAIVNLLKSNALAAEKKGKDGTGSDTPVEAPS
jgi:hypothetical protein